MPVYHRAPGKWSGREDPEDGPLARRFFQAIAPSAQRAILGFACDAGVKRNKGRPGAKDSPAAIRKSLAGLSTPENFPSITDLGDVVVDGDDLEAGHDLLEYHIKTALPDLSRLLVLGGGHETAFGSYRGLRAAYPDASIGIINFDAHFDLRKPAASGPSSGTPFHQIRDIDPKGFDYLCLGVAQESNTQALFQRAKDWGVSYLTDHEIAQDLGRAMDAIKAMSGRNDMIYLTIDMDVLPHYQAPGVSAPAARGVALDNIERLIDCVLADGSVPLADIVEVSPPFDRDFVTAKTAAILALRILGQ